VTSAMPLKLGRINSQAHFLVDRLKEQGCEMATIVDDDVSLSAQAVFGEIELPLSVHTVART